ncbi:hypothetical protein [Bremerella alba]|uniref:Signal recognition particle 54 kDa protein n=1 Tax=Bremerella alba TaxID=980252 RepID=A0A7V8V3V7_9BACT|nr:hypothetical protein [Bremerella alba]MBA2114391.1 Signal recognition particle 54 kDa protein [Bremerella alba]
MAHSFTLDDFRKQLEQITRPSLLKRMLGLTLGMGEMTKTLQSGEHQREMCRLGGMIDAMTPVERSDPKSIDLGRRLQIAKGTGVSPREATDLIKQFESMATLMKKMAEGGNRHAIEKLRELRRGELVDDWDDDDILGTDDDS